MPTIPYYEERFAFKLYSSTTEGYTEADSKWGHSKYFLWALDSGGTVFSDALLHITEAVNVNKLDMLFVYT